MRTQRMMLLILGVVVGVAACGGGGGLDETETKQAKFAADAFTQSMQMGMWDLAFGGLTPEAQSACGGDMGALEQKAKSGVRGKPSAYAMGELAQGEGKTATVQATLTVNEEAVALAVNVKKTGNVRWDVTGFSVGGSEICSS